MNKLLLLSALLISVLFNQAAFAQSNIAIIDLNGAIRVSDYSKKQYKLLQADENYKKLVSAITQTREELQKLQKEGETKSLTWSDKQKQDHQEKGQKKYAELNNLASQEASVRSRLDASVQQELASRVEALVNEIIEEKEIGLLLKAQAVYFRTADFDITEELVKRLNSSEQ
ncbi:OmpH family outer membrane protein [Eionea flava]